MWTECGAASPRGKGLLRAIGTILAVLVVSSAFAGASSRQQIEPPWRDADKASRQLADAQLEVLEARLDLATAQEDVRGLRESTELTAGDTLAAANQLVDAQRRARALIVEAYISGGSLNDVLYVLNSATANDLAFRTTLLSEGAEAVARTQSDYLALVDAASQGARDLAAMIERGERAIERAVLRIESAEAAIPDAEWVVTIAEIHRRADEQMVRWGRTEPTAEQWDNLRFCESTRDYQINTGNSFYGAYQFNLITWVDMGGNGLPSDASVEEQDARARYLYALRGSGYDAGGAWPVCGGHLP